MVVVGAWVETVLAWNKVMLIRSFRSGMGWWVFRYAQVLNRENETVPKSARLSLLS